MTKKIRITSLALAALVMTPIAVEILGEILMEILIKIRIKTLVVTTETMEAMTLIILTLKR